MSATTVQTPYESRPLGYLLRPDATLRDLWRRRDLIRQLTRRELAARYRGTVLGALWSFLLPLAMLAIYTFVFSVVFEARFDTPVSGSRAEFALMLFAGLHLHALLAETLTAAPELIIANPSYVKKVVFPLEVLPVVRLGSALVHALISAGLIAVGGIVFMKQASMTMLLYPLVLAPLVMFTLGLGWFLASLGVYLRDIAQVVGVLVTVLLFLTPIFYPLSAVPPAFQTVLRLNPLTVIVEAARRTLLRGEAPEWGWFVIVFVASAAAMQLGYAWFMKTKRGFADVI